MEDIDFENSYNFMKDKARPLDLALFEYEFHNGTKSRVVEELSKYQNKDGGFGHGIEPDVQLKSSSVYATTVGLQYIDMIELDKDHEIIENAISFLLHEMKSNDDIIWWPPLPVEVNNEPHAPWWGVEKIEAPGTENWANPNAEVIGYLSKYSHFVDEKIINRCKNDMRKLLDSIPMMQGYFYYNFLCWKRCMNKVDQKINSKIIELFDATFTDDSIIDKEKLGHVRVEWLVAEKSSYLNQKYPRKISKLIEAEMKDREEYGGFYPTWDWGDSYSDTWSQAKLDWAGKITFDFFSMLKYLDLLKN